MIKTEKKHWVTGYQKRGGGKHKTLALKIGNLGIMLTLHTIHKIPKFNINFYKLI